MMKIFNLKKLFTIFSLEDSPKYFNARLARITRHLTKHGGYS